MGRALVWVESLAAALLLVATLAAWTARRRTAIGRSGLPLLAATIIALLAGVFAYGLGFLHRMGPISLGSFLAATVWTTAFLIVSIAVIASRPRGDSDAAACRGWPVSSLALAFAGAAVLTIITVSNLDVAVKAQLAALRVEAGARAMSLIPPSPTDSPNAAPVYSAAFAALTPQEQLPALLRDRAQAWQEYDRTAFDPADREQREFLESQQRGLALLRQAAAIPHCSFDRDWSSETSPLDLLVPELPRLRYSATLLAYDALARATRGDSLGAIDDVAAIFGISRHIHYPLLIDVITAVAVEKTGARAFEDVLAVAPPKMGDVARMTAKMRVGSARDFRQQYHRALAMEEAWGLAAFVLSATRRASDSADLDATYHGGHPARSTMDALGEMMLVSALYRFFFLEEDLAAYRRHMREFRNLAALSGPAELDTLDKVEDKIRRTRGGGILSGPATVRGTLASLDGDATHDLVRVAVAAAAYKAKHGKYPDKLSELVAPEVPGEAVRESPLEWIAEVPPDPFDGRPIRMRHVDDGIILYSVGRDRKDDGGPPWNEKEHEGDIVFRLR
jgi:hypothetical protein